MASEDRKIGLRSLSAGEKHLLFILLHALMAEGSSLLLDEPEMSMHIDWQRELLQAIKELNPRAQVIAATHSPEIMANLPDDKIFKM